LCASSIGAFRTFFEAISALSQIVSRHAPFFASSLAVASRKPSAARSPAFDDFRPSD